MLQGIKDAIRKRQVELNNQEHRKDKSKSLRVDPDVTNPKPQPSGNIPHFDYPEATPGSAGVNVELIEKELFRENQLNRAEQLIEYYEGNRKILEKAHDKYEAKLNDASSAYEAQLYNYHVARI